MLKDNLDKEFIKEIIRLLNQMEFSKFELKVGDFHIKLEKEFKTHPMEPVSTSLPSSASSSSPAATSSSKEQEATSEEGKEDYEKKYHVIKSPLVGTFYRSPAPGAPPFVEEGDIVSPGQVLCIIEALKVMNEIESDVRGRIVKILVENGQPVEYGQPLFLIDTNV
jgi:acetyl-CoA carboxylase biotin carboxyl carrier protein